MKQKVQLDLYLLQTYTGNAKLQDKKEADLILNLLPWVEVIRRMVIELGRFVESKDYQLYGSSEKMKLTK